MVVDSDLKAQVHTMASHSNCALGTSMLQVHTVPIQSLAIFLAAQIAAKFLDKN